MNPLPVPPDWPMPSGSPVLSLQELEAFDPRALQGGGEGRFLCPLCGQGKPKDAAHRSLTMNVRNGAWQCFRCAARGKLREMWDERLLLPRRERARTALKAAFALDPALDMVAASPSPQNASEHPKPKTVGWRAGRRGHRCAVERKAPPCRAGCQGTGGAAECRAGGWHFPRMAGARAEWVELWPAHADAARCRRHSRAGAACANGAAARAECLAGDTLREKSGGLRTLGGIGRGRLAARS